MAELDYDVFLSHSSKNKRAARELAERLRTAGLKVWFDEWEIRPGDVIGLRIEKGLEASRVLVFLLSAEAFESEWAALERQTILFRDPTNRERRFLPVRIDDAALPPTLAQFAYVDWRKPSDAEFRRLFEACRPGEVGPEASPAGVAKPRPRRTIAAHVSDIMWMASSPDGTRLVTASIDHSLKVWDTETWACVGVLEGHERLVRCVVFTPSGERIISCAYDRTVKIWDVASKRCLKTIEMPVDENDLFSVAVKPDASQILVGSRGSAPLSIWDLDTGLHVADVPVSWEEVYSIAIAPSGERAIFGGDSGALELWDLATNSRVCRLDGHGNDVFDVAFAADGRRAVSASSDRTARVWDLSTGMCLAVLEGHDRGLLRLRLSVNGRYVYSGSGERMDTSPGRTIAWDLETGRQIFNIQHEVEGPVGGICLLEDRHTFVTGHEQDLLVWDLPEAHSVAAPTDTSALYTNAKVVLVGESGVGKTGLAVRLAHDRWEISESTHSMQVYRLELPRNPRTPNIDHEVWLWDFAGQPDYRLIHQLFMDETALALLVLDPQRKDPFAELIAWDKSVQTAARRAVAKLLVAARSDRGGVTVSRQKIDQFREERGYAAFVRTSAKTGAGRAELLDAVAAHIPWDRLPWTSTTRLFKLLKDAIVALREQEIALVRLAELRQRLQFQLPGEVIGEPELRAVVGLLTGQGLIQKLDFGDFVLLQPEWLNRYAAAIVRVAREHAEEIGCVPERDVLDARIDFADMKRLAAADEAILLRAMVQGLLDRALCLREETSSGDHLVFPSYFNRDRPELVQHPNVFVSYEFSGELDHIYSTLIVRLSRTGSFVKDELWRDAADFKTHGGKRVGLAMRRAGDARAEITVYFEAGVPTDTQVSFIKYVHEHLLKRATDVTRTRHYACPHCNAPVQDREAVRRRLARGQNDVICLDCEKRVPLLDVIEEKFASGELLGKVREMDLRASVNIDNESRELILVGHTFAIAGEAGQIFRPTANSDWGIDGEIEFKNDRGEASGRRVYLQLKSGDSYLETRAAGGGEIFRIKNPRHAEYWQSHAYPVMLVVRTSDGSIRWMNITDALKGSRSKRPRQIIFEGEPFTALNLMRMRDRLFAST